MNQSARSMQSSQQVSRKQSKTFFSILSNQWRVFYSKFLYVSKKFNKMLWVGTTGFILLLLPISFAVFIETDLEMQKMLKQSEMAGMGSR